MIINNRTDLDTAPKDVQAEFKQRLAASINSWQWDGQWNLTQNTTTIEQFGFTVADFPDAPVPEQPDCNPDQQEQERKATEAVESRRQAYIAESDPVFFMAQRGEATMEEWQAKVDEIKQRFPK